MPKNYNISFQCKYTHEYNNLLFHLFADQVMNKEGCGVSPEANMHEALVLFMWESIDKVKEISQNFLKEKVFLWMTKYNTFPPPGTGVMSLCCTYCASCKAYITVLSLKLKFIISTPLPFHPPLQST